MGTNGARNVEGWRQENPWDGNYFDVESLFFAPLKGISPPVFVGRAPSQACTVNAPGKARWLSLLKAKTRGEGVELFFGC